MLGDSTALEGGGASSGDDAAAATAAAAASAGGAAEAHDGGESAIVAAAGGGGGAGSNSGEEGGGGDRSFGGNRWPRQETLALLKIRSDMDVAFRDASVKGPLWDEVSRKLAELGYHRSAKKCKEKFENVYKYHKRTKEGRTGKPYGKTYRFFDQLEALDQHHHHQNHPHNNTNSLLIQSSSSNAAPLPAPPVSVIPTTQPPPSVMVAPQVAPPYPPPPHVNASTTIPSMNTSSIPPLYPPPPASTTTTTANPTFIPSFASIPTDLLSNSSSSSTSSDETIEARRKRKRKWKDFFERLMKEVIEKQEELQKRFLEAIEKREHERMVREESWRMQEMARINKEREILAQERSIAAAKDAAVMAFLQKIAEQQNPGQPAPTTNNISIPNPPSQPTATPAPAPAPAPVIAPPPPQPLQPVTVQQSTSVLSTPPPAPPPSAQQGITSMEIVMKTDNGDNSNLTMPSSATPGTSSSRWPKVEVETLIKLRSNLDAKYQENGPKGPLWEEISAAMRKLGYNRSSKRCKEKWENINKYFKKVKESNKRRPEDSKTCPYFHQLDALYREKKFKLQSAPPPPPDNMSTPLMVRPEQQWPPQPQTQTQPQLQDTRPSGPQVMMGSAGNDAMEEEDEEEDKDREEEDDDDDDDGGSGTYEIVASTPATSVGASE
ncbi:trihelix transcription factor GT-2 [Neltuma alba]|uniref:trihelix transcription factor GT-2 n=1 Tax=Neltuma alba TaxID=207710 RepID=UPI0010A51579|nr:trihelix transcription factor GT-2-like [Prosopis alba]